MVLKNHNFSELNNKRGVNVDFKIVKRGECDVFVTKLDYFIGFNYQGLNILEVNLYIRFNINWEILHMHIA